MFCFCCKNSSNIFIMCNECRLFELCFVLAFIVYFVALRAVVIFHDWNQIIFSQSGVIFAISQLNMLLVLCGVGVLYTLGSPFVVEIANPAVVTVAGDGLSIGQRGQKASFMIDCTAASFAAADITVSVSRKSSWFRCSTFNCDDAKSVLTAGIYCSTKCRKNRRLLKRGWKWGNAPLFIWHKGNNVALNTALTPAHLLLATHGLACERVTSVNAR